MAEISRTQWNRYITRLRQINDKAVEDVEAYLARKGGFEALDRTDLIDYAYYISNKYGEASAALSASMYDALAELSGVTVPAAVPAEVTYQDVAKTVNGIIKKTGNGDILAQGIGRLVKMAGTDTILSNAHRDRPKGRGSKRRHTGAQVAWIPVGDTCPFCLMLASKGWMNQTEWGANSHSEHIHANCDCTYAVRFNNDLGFEGYDPDEYKAMYDNAEGKTRNEKFNSMRRDYYADNKDKINAQKRAAYQARKDLTNDENGGIIKVRNGGSEPLRIPQIPASSVSKKVESGEYSLRLTQQSYDKHVPGTKTYDIYLNARQEKGLNPQSVLTIDKAEAQDIIIKKSGTGIIKPRRDGSATDIEQITCDKVIGYYYQQGKKVPTNKAAIHHGKKGSHLVPIKGNHYD